MRIDPTRESVLQDDAALLELAEMVPAILWRADAQTFQFTYVSPHAETLLGYPAQQWLEDPAFWPNHIYPPDRDSAIRYCREATGAGRDHELTYRMVAADGRLVWLRDVVRVRMVAGQPVEVFGVMFDETAQKEAEHALLERQEELQLALDGAQMGIWNWDLVSNTLHWSREVKVIFGLDPETFQETYRTYLECMHPEDKERVAALIKDALRESDTYHVEHRIMWPDGSVHWIEGKGKVYRNTEGTAVRMTGTVVEITDRKQREQERKAESAFRKAIIQRAAEGICVCHATDTFPFVHFTVWNEQMTRITGYTIGEINRDGWYQTLYPDEDVRTRAIERMSRMREGDDILGEEWTIRHADGTSRVLSISTSVLPSAGIEQVLAVIHDITQHKVNEEVLRAAKEEAEKMNQLKSAFLANMSHEIRTPLTSIIGFAGLLQEEHLGEPADDFAHLIGRSGRRLLETLNAVLDLSQLEAGAMPLYPQMTNVATQVTSALEMVQPLLHEGEITLHIEADAEACEAILDPNAVQRIVLNLVNNAIKFTDAGGQIFVRIQPTDTCVQLEVEDTGVGIAAEFVPHVFDAFKQESSGVQRAYQGSGLGLAITKQLVDLMEGTITVESTKNVGTHFTIRVPRWQPEAEDV